MDNNVHLQHTQNIESLQDRIGEFDIFRKGKCWIVPSTCSRKFQEKVKCKTWNTKHENKESEESEMNHEK